MAKKLYIKEKFGQTPNSLLNHSSISMKAKGLYSYIQSKPGGWDFSVRRISKQSAEGISSIQAGLKELEKYGYLKRIKYQTESGHWKTDYLLCYEPCIENQHKEKPCVENPNKENPNKENYLNKEKKNLEKKNNSKNNDDEKKIDINILFKKYIDDAEVVQSVVKNHRLKDKDELIRWLKKFQDSLKETGKTSKTFTDYASHFRNWLSISKNKNQSDSNQSSKIPLAK